MSLLLRKACQPILDAANMPNHHVEIDINNMNKHLHIVGECGQPLIQIQGITFSRNTPTKTEIEYAAELLQAFLVKYHSKIDEYLTRKTTNGLAPEHELFDTYFGPNYIEVGYTDKNIIRVILTVTEDDNIAIDINLKLSSKKSPPNILDDFKHDAVILTQAKIFAKQINKWNKEDQEIKALKTNLSVCNI